ncbi:MAG TPA: ribonuclease E inhibitor RraB [Gaiellaceae bacterium]|nr:ribonuclease E inhibitor RraB [Gaiellaceae bacterium]
MSTFDEDAFRDEEPDPGDAAVLEQLRALGTDLSREREVVHYMYVPAREAATALADIVRNEGYAAEVREPSPGDAEGPYSWGVVATGLRVVSEESVREARMTLTELAAEHGGMYDGWEAAAD